MSVSFDGEQQRAQQSAPSQGERLVGMSGWLVRKGLAANQTSADLTLVMLAIVLALISVFFFFNNGSVTPPPYTEDLLGAPPQNGTVTGP